MRTQQLSAERRHSHLLFTSHAIHTIHDNVFHSLETLIHFPHLQCWKVYSSWEQQCFTFHHEFTVPVDFIQIILEDVTERFSITSRESKFQWSEMREVYSSSGEEKRNWRMRPCYIHWSILLLFPLSLEKPSLFIISSLCSHSPLSACDSRRNTHWVPFPFQTEESSADRILLINHFPFPHFPVGKKCTSHNSCSQSPLRSMQDSLWWWTRPPSHTRSSCQSEWTGWRSDSHTWRKTRWGRRRRDRWRIGGWGIGRGR